MSIPSHDLTLGDIPAADCSDGDIIRFAQTLNGYTYVGGAARDLGAYVARREGQAVATLSLDELRILLFARQRAHYHQGGGWPDSDPLMEQMRELTAEIRSRFATGG